MHRRGRGGRGVPMNRSVNASYSEFTLPSLPEYQEKNDFDAAVKSHTDQINLMRERIVLLEERVKILQAGKSEKVFHTPSEYDRYLERRREDAIIEERRREMVEKERELEKKNKEAKTKVDEVKRRWSYYWRCFNYLNESSQFIGILPSLKLRGQTLTEKTNINEIPNNSDVADINTILDTMLEVITEAHKMHNDHLISICNKKYPCPRINYCSYDGECYATLDDKRTTGCQKEFYWTTKNVDFLDGCSLDDTSPKGEVVAC